MISGRKRVQKRDTLSSSTDLVMDWLKNLRLKAKSPEARCKAIDALGESSDPRDVKTLIENLAEPDPQFRIAAARALGRTGHEDALNPLLAALRDPDPGVREAATRGLSSLGNQNAIDS